MNQVYKLVTDKIIEKLEAGCVPWRKTWSSETPKNLVSGKEYRGINSFLLIKPLTVSYSIWHQRQCRQTASPRFIDG